MRASSARRLAVWLYTLVWAVFYAGILGHTSSEAALAGKYSYKYLAALALGLVPFAFPRALRKTKTLEYFSDDVHSTPKGARVVAETIADVIIRAGYLK